MKEQVLFIDDDNVLLDGLRRLLRHMRSEWDITFCSSGVKALEMMQQRCFDVVVSDMRMPELDGARVLSGVRDICPNSVRMVLSGQAEFETVLRALSAAHQYISKPCNPEQLKFILQKACKMRRLMRCENLSAFVSGLEKIPGDIEIYNSFLNELSSETPVINELMRLASCDISLALKLLHLTNSGFFGSRAAVFSPGEAVTTLGIVLLKRLAQETEVFTVHPSSVYLQRDIQMINHHSMSVAHLARDVALQESDDKQFAEACFAAGLLHDLGKIVLAAYDPQRYTEAFRRSLNSLVELEQEEKKLFGASHSEVGSYLMALWGFPEPIIEATAHHHAPAAQTPCTFGVTSIVHVTNALQDCIESSELKNALKQALPRFFDGNYVQRVQSDGRLCRWLELFQATIPCYEGVVGGR